MRSLEGVPSYYTGVREEMAAFVPEGVRRMLDVGCGAGTFGAHLRETRGIEAWGIEMAAEAIPHARERLDRLEAGDAFSVLPTLPPAHFDLVTFNDVLEHFAWPDEALRLTRPLLAPGGRVLASLPNFRFWGSFKEVVIDGKFEYQDQGVFDRTHLRFYTKRSVPDLFRSAGFEVESIVGINEFASKKLRLLNLIFRNRFEDCRYLQYAVLARPV